MDNHKVKDYVQLINRLEDEKLISQREVECTGDSLFRILGSEEVYKSAKKLVELREQGHHL
jgi:hypothetical protein